ncbi:MAG: helix-turn-helix transcriptional regulator [Clostridia bacterium]|nr:helix-turn-helix transcriptional regulator [Clostridia bacterium]
MVDYTAMGRRMKARRRAKKLSQEEMAHAVQISISFYGNIERGTRIPSVDTLVSIANVLEVGTDYLLADSIKAASNRHSKEDTRVLCQFLREKIAELDYGDESN